MNINFSNYNNPTLVNLGESLAPHGSLDLPQRSSANLPDLNSLYASFTINQTHEIEGKLREYFIRISDSEKELAQLGDQLEALMWNEIRTIKWTLFTPILQEIISSNFKLVRHPSCHNALFIFLLICTQGEDKMLFSEIDPSRIGRYEELLKALSLHPLIQLIHDFHHSVPQATTAHDLEIVNDVKYLIDMLSSTSSKKFLSSIDEYGYKIICAKLREKDVNYTTNLHHHLHQAISAHPLADVALFDRWLQLKDFFDDFVDAIVRNDGQKFCKNIFTDLIYFNAWCYKIYNSMFKDFPKLNEIKELLLSLNPSVKTFLMTTEESIKKHNFTTKTRSLQVIRLCQTYLSFCDKILDLNPLLIKYDLKFRYNLIEKRPLQFEIDFFKDLPKLKHLFNHSHSFKDTFDYKMLSHIHKREKDPLHQHQILCDLFLKNVSLHDLICEQTSPNNFERVIFYYIFFKAVDYPDRPFLDFIIYTINNDKLKFLEMIDEHTSSKLFKTFKEFIPKKIDLCIYLNAGHDLSYFLPEKTAAAFSAKDFFIKSLPLSSQHLYKILFMKVEAVIASKNQLGWRIMSLSEPNAVFSSHEALVLYQSIVEKTLSLLKEVCCLNSKEISIRNFLNLFLHYFKIENDLERKKDIFDRLLNTVAASFSDYLDVIQQIRETCSPDIPALELTPIVLKGRTLAVPITSPLPLALQPKITPFATAPFSNFLNHLQTVNKFKSFVDNLEREWFQKTAVAKRMTNELRNNQLLWSFAVNEVYLVPLTQFLEEMKDQRNAALCFLKEVIRFFNLRTTEPYFEEPLITYQKGGYSNASQVIHALIAFDSKERETPSLTLPLDENVCLQLAYTMLVNKWKEFKAKTFFWFHSKKSFPNSHAQTKHLFILARDNRQARVFALGGHFDKKQSLILIQEAHESELALFTMINQPHLNKEKDGTFVLTAQDLEKLQTAHKHLRNHPASSPMDDVVILERIKPPFSLLEENLPLEDLDLCIPAIETPSFSKETKQNKSKATLKRKFDEITSCDDSIRLDLTLKSHNKDPLSTISNTNVRGNAQAIELRQNQGYHEVEIEKPSKKRKTRGAKENGEVTVSSSVMRKEPILDAESIDPLKMWQHLSDFSIDRITEDVKAMDATHRLLIEGKQQAFPITKKLEELQPLPSFQLFNPRLMGYQNQAVQELWTGLKQGVSKILALEMGLGKTFIILELLMQSIAEGTKGAHLLIVPVSTANQMLVEAIRFQQDVRCDSLKKLLSTPQGKGLVKHNLQRLQEDILDVRKISQNLQNPRTKTSDKEALMEQLKGAIRIFALLKEFFGINWSQGLSNPIKDALKEIATRHWEHLFTNSEAHENQKVWLKQQLHIFFSQPIGGIRILDDDHLIDLNALFRLNDEDFLSATGELLNLNFHPKNEGDTPPGHLLNVLFAPSVKKVSLEKISGDGIYILKHSAMEDLKKLNEQIPGQIAFAAVDESHRFNNAENATAKSMKEFLVRATYKLLVTGTPLGNNYKELLHQIEMANPEAFTFDAVQALDQLFNRYIKVIAYTQSTFEHESKHLIESFVHFYELSKMLKRMVIFLNKEHPQVVENWQGRIPVLEHIHQTVIVKDPGEYQRITSLFLKSQNNMGQPAYEKQIKKLLIHPKVQDFKGKDLKGEALNFFKNQPIRSWIDESDMFREFFKDPTTKKFRNPYIQECVDKKSKGIVFVDLLLAGEVCKLVLESSGDVEISMFTGEMDEKTRSEAIAQFKAQPKSDRAQILIMLIKAGGVGLNLAWAEFVFLVCETYSLIDKLQALKRVDRVGNVGLKRIVHFAYNIFLSKHIQIINLKKNQWIDFILPNEDLSKKFERWLSIGELSAKQAILNKTKNEEEAQKIFQAIAQKIQNLRDYYKPQRLHEEFHQRQFTYTDQLDEMEVDDEINRLCDQLQIGGDV